MGATIAFEDLILCHGIDYLMVLKRWRTAHLVDVECCVLAIEIGQVFVASDLNVSEDSRLATNANAIESLHEAAGLVAVRPPKEACQKCEHFCAFLGRNLLGIYVAVLPQGFVHGIKCFRALLE